MSKERMGVNMRGVLLFMFNAYACWRKDVYTYAMSLSGGNGSTASNVYHKLLTRGYLEEYEPVYPQAKSIHGLKEKSDEDISQVLESNTSQPLFRKLTLKNKSSYVMTIITQRGINWIVDYYSQHEYFYNHRNGELGVRFRTTDRTKLVRQLMKSRALAVMAGAGTAVFPYEKPSMYRLYGYVNNGAEGTYNEEMEREQFPDYLALDQAGCLDLLNTTGVYYTGEEVSECINLAFAGRSDTFKGSRFFGVYISNMTAFILYQEYPGADKQIGIRTSIEKRLEGSINEMFVDELTYRRKVPYKDAYTQLYTAIISDGDSLCYSMVTQTRNGRIRFSESEMSSPEKMRDRIAKINEFAQHKKVLGSNTSAYPRVFVIPATNTGILSMEYLCHHSVADYFRDSAELIRSRPDLFVSSSTMIDPFVFGWEKESFRTSHRYVIFMPVYEINLVRYLSAGSENPDEADEFALITLPQMADALSHGIRKHTAFYDTASFRKIMIDQETNKPLLLSHAEIEMINLLISANKIFGYGEYWSYDQFNIIKNDPTLISHLSDVVIKSPLTDKNKKLVPREVTQYQTSGIPVDDVRDRYRDRRKSDHDAAKRYRHPNQARLELVLDASEKKLIRQAANILNVSATELTLTFVLPRVREVIAMDKEGKSQQIQDMKRAIGRRKPESEEINGEKEE